MGKEAGIGSILNDLDGCACMGFDFDNLLCSATRVWFANGTSSAGAPCAQHDDGF